MDFDLTRFATTLVEAMPDGVIYADADGIVRFWSTGAERIFGSNRRRPPDNRSTYEALTINQPTGD